jgi:hypothetical protein
MRERHEMLETTLSLFSTAKLVTFRLVSPELDLAHTRDVLVESHAATLQHLHYNIFTTTLAEK